MRCPDGGTCHHNCTGGCFRVLACAPFSNLYPGDRWPAEMVAEHKSRYKNREPEQLELPFPT